MKTFGQRVRAARHQQGWTQQELANASGLTQSAIGNYETGLRTDPTSAALLKLADALNVTPEWLQHGSANQQAAPPRSRSARSMAQTGQPMWPFTRIGSKDLDALSAAEKQILETVVEAFIRTCRLPR